MRSLQHTVADLRRQLADAGREAAAAQQQSAAELQQHMVAQQQLLREFDAMKVRGGGGSAAMAMGGTEGTHARLW